MLLPGFGPAGAASKWMLIVKWKKQECTGVYSCCWSKVVVTKAIVVLVLNEVNEKNSVAPLGQFLQI